MTSILVQAITMPSALSSFLPWIALFTLVGLGYMVFFQKDKRTIELLTTSKIAIPTIFLIAMAVAPSSVMALFGAIEPIMTFLVQVFIAVLISLVIIAIPAYIIRAIKPEWIE